MGGAHLFQHLFEARLKCARRVHNLERLAGREYLVHRRFFRRNKLASRFARCEDTQKFPDLPHGERRHYGFYKGMVCTHLSRELLLQTKQAVHIAIVLQELYFDCGQSLRDGLV